MEDTVSSSEMWLSIEVNRSHRDLRRSRYCEDILVLEEDLEVFTSRVTCPPIAFDLLL